MKDATLEQKRLGLRIHATVFVPVVGLQLIINGLIGPPYWSLWVLRGWGVGLFCHWYFVLGPGARKTEPA
jgi:2TM domain